MNITLENYRAQIGTHDYGSVIVSGDAVKTVNKGWFARNVTCLFGTKTTAAQNQAAAMNLYKAVKASVGNVAPAEKAEFLQEIGEKLGVQDVDGLMVCVHPTPLKRRTVQEIVLATDKFKFQLYQDTLELAQELVVDLAKKVRAELDIKENHELDHYERRQIRNTIQMVPVYRLKAGAIPYAPILDVEHAKAFLADRIEHSSAFAEDRETRSMAAVLLADLRHLEKFDPKKCKDAEDLAGKLIATLGDRRLSARGKDVLTAAQYLRTTIWADADLVRFFRHEVECELNMKARENGVACHLFDPSTDLLKRLANRQIGKVLAAVVNEKDFATDSMIDKTKTLARLCVKAISVGTLSHYFE